MKKIEKIKEKYRIMIYSIKSFVVLLTNAFHDSSFRYPVSYF